MKQVFSILFSLLSAAGLAQDKQQLKLWYTHPSGNTWENALPVGNGRLGAMIYGNTDKEVIQLNEHTVWSGSPNRNDNPLALDSLEIIRKLIFEGRQKEAEIIANRVIITRKSHGQMFQPVGSLQLAFAGHEHYTNYYRELDIERAVQRTAYTVDGVIFTREALASFPDRVIVMHLTASKPGRISFTATFTTPQPKAVVTTTPDKELTIAGTTIDHEGVKGLIKFKGIAKFKLDGGSLVANDTSLVVKNANAVTIYISIATNFNNYHDITGDENNRAAGYLNKAYARSFAAMLPAHIAAYQKYFHRVRLDLGTTNAVNAPTDERLKNFNAVNDPQFVTLYYQFGRYLLISSSQPGGQAANLQGIWNDRLHPAWDSKYTININAEMNYWPAEKTNLAEMHEPFLQLVKDLSITGQQTAREMYGARGWVAHHNTDIWRATGAVDGAAWGVWNAAGGWTSRHLWEHYLYSGDKTFLASVYPVLKGAATFYVDFLVEHPRDHWLVINPDMSPENTPAAHQGSSLDAGTTMTNQIVFDLFSATIKAAEILKKDPAFADTLKQMRKRLPPMQIGQHGQLQEWIDDIDDPNDHHRHISHLYGLFPSNQISPYRTPELYSAAKNTLTQRGDVSTGWSMGWKVNWWARMLDGNHAYKLIQNQLSPVQTDGRGSGGTYNNLFDAHPPFQIDGNFGCTSGITEMIMQSANGEIQLIPALPDVWLTGGSITGLRAIGGFEIVSMEWKDGRVVQAVIRSKLGGNLRLRVPNAMRLNAGGSLKTATGRNANPFYDIEDTPVPVISGKAAITPPQLKETMVYDLPTRPGETYTFVEVQGPRQPGPGITADVRQPGLVRIDGGWIQGSVEGDLIVFKGIPFAAPPVGDLRWRAPQLVIKWNDVKQTTGFAPAPVQGGNPPSGKSEDCLYLNVWTPARSAKESLPVLVWIYGGGFSFGSTGEPSYNGEKLAKKGVVFVSIAYRVGQLGFLAHPELSAENPDHVSGNYGLLDQIAGLQWIQRNIAAFGGDPDKVTIFGESAGAISVSMLCASPLAKGLFHGAISQSGGSFGPTRPTTFPGENMKTLRQAEADGQAYLQKAGVPSIAGLRKMDADKLPSAWGIGSAWPIVDGYVIPGDQCDLYKVGKYNDVPVMMGYNSDEGASFSPGRTPEEHIAGVRSRYGKFADTLIKAYPVGKNTVPKTARDLVRDAAFGWHTWCWARLQSKTGRSKVYYYYFDQHPDYPVDSPRHGYGSPHGQDVSYVFQHIDPLNPQTTNSDLEISEAMGIYWTNFAKSGNPNGKGVPDWPAFGDENPAVMYFGPTPHKGPVPDEGSLKVLDEYFTWRRTPEGTAWAR